MTHWLASPDRTADDRVKAADTLQEVRDRYAKLAKEFGDTPELVEEALMGVAKADEVLAAIPKADNPKEPRETLDTALAGLRTSGEALSGQLSWQVGRKAG